MRDEPFPSRAYFNGEPVRYICLTCQEAYISAKLQRRGVEAFDLRLSRARFKGSDGYKAFAAFMLGKKSAEMDAEQLRMEFKKIVLSNEEVIFAPTTVEIIAFSGQLREDLRRDLSLVHRLTEDEFELLICDRLSAMGMGVQRVGSVYSPDGGIDIVAWPESGGIFPFLLAVQAKHHRQPGMKTGAADVREFTTVVQDLPFQAGMLVTNTNFTADARWVAEHRPTMIRLRDFEDLKRWIRDEFVDEAEWREIPEYIEYAPGRRFKIPWKSALRKGRW